MDSAIKIYKISLNIDLQAMHIANFISICCQNAIFCVVDEAFLLLYFWCLHYTQVLNLQQLYIPSNLNLYSKTKNI